MRVSINNFTDFRMAKESSLQLFPIDLFVKKLIMLWKSYINIMGNYNYNGRIKIYWSEIIFTISIKENIVFVILFGTSFISNTLASFTRFQCQDTETFGSIQM